MGRRTTAFNNGQARKNLPSTPGLYYYNWDPYNSIRDPYNSNRDPYNSNRDPYNSNRDPYNSNRDPYNSNRDPYNSNRDPYNSNRDPYNSNRDPYNSNSWDPYNFLENQESEDDEIFDVPSATGFLAWAITCTLAIILIILKKYLVKTFHPCNQCNVESQPLPETQPTSADTQATAADTQTTSADTQATSADTQATSADTQATSATSADTQPTSADTQPSVAIPTINTPSHSIATPSSSFYDTPLQSATLSTTSSTTVLGNITELTFKMLHVVVFCLEIFREMRTSLISRMAAGSLLKEILDSLEDPDVVQLFAAANGLVGDAEVEYRLRELHWEKHIEDLWQEVLSEMESPAKKSRPTLADDDQPSTSVQLGAGEESSDSEDTSTKPYYIWKRDTRTFMKHWVRDTTFKVKFNEQWRGKKLIDIQSNLHDMFEDLLLQARGHDADLGRVVISHPSLNNAIVVPLQSWETLNADVAMSEIVKVLNSNESLPIDESLLVTIGSIDLPKGGGNKFVRVTKDQEKPRLYLYHIDSENEKHWHGIASIQGFFKASYFCHTCLKPYKDKSKHSCATSCEVCLRNNCPETDVQMGCCSCGRVCRSLACFKSHKEKRTVKNESYPPACDLFYQCTKCRVVMKRVKRSPELHVCEEWQCPNCQEYQIGEHNCYQKPFGSDIEKRNKKFFFYDFETRQDDVFQCEAGYSPSRVRCRHCVKEPRQCVNCKLCQNCRDPSCGLMQHKVNFAVLQSTCHQCEKEELVEGATCSHCGTRCGSCSRTLKGEYVSPPCQDTCGKRELVFSGDYTAEHFCAYVTSKEKIQITKDGDTKWYDIEHLRGLQVVNVEESWVSLVDLQNDENVQIGKRQFESPIAVVPSQGYTKRDNYSKVSIQWLEWLMEKSRQRGNSIHISHALNGGEFQIPGTNYRCDGFVPSSTGKGTVYEFYSCVFHGCPSCYAEDRHHLRHPSTNQTIQELYEMTKKRERELKDL
uniref:Uncharacterized protein n=1 Tax=Magallana gigas TaxID=29159 RepID=A0A8W8MIW4_MAGGI